MWCRLLLAAGLAWPVNLLAQIGGAQVFDYLRLPVSPRQAALGGTAVALPSTDAALAQRNPAQLSKHMHQRVYFSWVDHLAGINYGTAGYAQHIEGFGTVHAAYQFVNYGTFTEADEFGNRLGTFRASDNALTLGVGREVAENLRVGANLKVLNANIYRQSAWGLAADLGIYYYYEKWDLHIAAVAQNLGVQLSAYSGAGQKHPLPFDLQLGLAKRLPHTPLRFSVTGIQLHRGKLAYLDLTRERQVDLQGNVVEEKITTVEQVFRHTVFGLEFLLNKNLHLRAGYNHLRRRELRSPENNGINLNGFSMGLGLRINRFYLDYAYANYHVVGGTHQFQFSTFLPTFKKGWQYDPNDYEYDYN
ncbi:MAG: type IX secretion system protein PorQ [Bacteroidetes bacterium]|nr:type IX secretion system protein PorQ [Bacteroidota bacterium]